MTDREKLIAQQEILRIMQTCVHFNGIQNRACNAGVKYWELVGDEKAGCATALPCLGETWRKPTDRLQVACDKRQTPTRAEAESEHNKQYAAVARVLTELSSGICPHCRQPAKQRQVGHCVYGVPCGHRMYQGKVNQDFAEIKNV